jgi:hypothetical protein
MKTDILDRLLWFGLLLILAALLIIVYLAKTSPQPLGQETRKKGNEQQTLREAQNLIRQQRYVSVESLIKSGQFQQSLLKLEEISKSTVGDPHAFILRGEVLAKMGAYTEAAANFSQGVRLDGSYVDKSSPLSHRETISQIVNSELKRSRASTTNQSFLNDLRYLQSRLAGGCE